MDERDDLRPVPSFFPDPVPCPAEDLVEFHRIVDQTRKTIEDATVRTGDVKGGRAVLDLFLSSVRDNAIMVRQAAEAHASEPCACHDRSADEEWKP